MSKQPHVTIPDNDDSESTSKMPQPPSSTDKNPDTKPDKISVVENPSFRLRKSDSKHSVNVVVWGAAGSGKSTFVGGWFFSDRNGWQIRAENDDANDFWSNAISQMSDERSFVSPSPVDEVLFLPFTFESPKGLWGSTKKYLVTIPECSGEKFEALDPELAEEIFSYDSILWLIDPSLAIRDEPLLGGAPNYRTMIQQWLDKLYRRTSSNKIKKNMAFCLTKMDHPDHYQFAEDPKSYVEEVLGPDVTQLISDYCSDSKIAYFSTSSIGFNPTTRLSNAVEKTIDPIEGTISYTIGKKLTSRPNPFGLLDPIFWCFKNS